MWYVDAADFAPLEAGLPGHQDPLLVHRRGSSGSSLLIFVHGLGGSRYTTWGGLPSFLYSDLPHVDLGLYDYSSGLRRTHRQHSVDLQTHAQELADTIRDGPYDRVVLLGHSMGGLLAKATIGELIDSQTRTWEGRLALERISGLFLLATPQAGSTRAPAWLTPFSRDARILKAHSSFITTITRRFNDRVVTTSPQTEPNSKVHIPTFAVLATEDRWVDEFSAGLNLSRDQTKTVRGSHTSLVKPPSRQDEMYQWLVHRLERCFAPPPPDATTTQRETAVLEGTAPETSTVARELAEALGRARGGPITINIGFPSGGAPDGG